MQLAHSAPKGKKSCKEVGLGGNDLQCDDSDQGRYQSSDERQTDKNKEDGD